MDRKKMEQQAQILRNKRMAKSVRRQPPIVSQGHVQLSKPLPKKPSEINMNPPAAAKARITKAENILEQRKNIQARRESPPVNDSLVIKPLPKKGCSGCGRKK